MVQDPNFWRRFSVAVHNDEAAILANQNVEGGTKGTRETKHAYVVSLSSPIDSPSSISTPTSQCHLSPAFPSAAFTRPVSAPAHGLPSTPMKRASRADSVAAEQSPEMIALHTLPSPHPLALALDTALATPKSAHFAIDANAPKRASQRASRFRFALSSHPPSLPPTPKSPAFNFGFADSSAAASKRSSRCAGRTASRLSLGVSLSGRPRGAFRCWTTITADAERSDSWLEGQQRKARQRMYMCWAFWLVFLVVVVGAIVAVLVLKGKGII
ncbi:hypothetical protein C7974DRAFT_373519 [Boeremia exigua]|uniref:uncharacterized protein n=1 Tax=Boeremia exigua TaxID=749465 RepID=UPI001E8CC4F0|nr:uncharacterized protein C7974DRAFT_373519 [Boeremia exigua]KAH6639262.1 hypothetical protein C7974DRAFT_373519 [Boeremia exigua]